MRIKGGSLLKSSANSPQSCELAGNIVIDRTQPGTRGASQGHTDPSVFTGKSKLWASGWPVILDQGTGGWPWNTDV